MGKTHVGPAKIGFPQNQGEMGGEEPHFLLFQYYPHLEDGICNQLQFLLCGTDSQIEVQKDIEKGLTVASIGYK